MNKPFAVFTERFDGIYRGPVIDNNDPLKRGRCKIRIMPTLAGVTDADLPWSIPAYPIFTGAGNGIGYFAVPDNGTLVYCFCEEGNINSPVYFAESPTGVHGIPSSATTNYPTRKVQRTSSGIEIYIDDTAKEIKLTHPTSGTIIMNSGGVVINSTGAITIVGSTVSINP